MRWKEPTSGDIKIKKKFAILPICIKNEVRWLEWVTIRYVYFCSYGWEAREFIDEDKEIIEE